MRGRFYFSPPGTPFYPHPHNLFSSNWTNAEYVPPPALGQTTNRPGPYSKGKPPDTLPPAVLLGSVDCIENGETFPLALVERYFVDGIDSRCWLVAGETPPPGPTCQIPILFFSLDFVACPMPCVCLDIALPFRFAFGNPTPPGPGPRVELPFRLTFGNPTPPGPGPRVELPFRFIFNAHASPAFGTPIPIPFRFAFADPTPPGPGPRVEIPFRFDFADPTPPGPGPRVEIPFAFDWTVDASGGDIPTVCQPGGTAPTLTGDFVYMGAGVGPPDYHGPLTWDGVGQWTGTTGGYIFYLRCDSGGMGSWLAGVSGGGDNASAMVGTTPGDPFGTTMFAGSWGGSPAFYQATISA